MNKQLTTAFLTGLMLCATSLPVWSAEKEASQTYRMAQSVSDPLNGMDLPSLEQQKRELLSQKVNPINAAALSAVIPGVGHVYAKQPQKGAWVAAGFAATLALSFFGSYLISGTNNTAAKTAAVLVNVVPPSAYMAWSATDAYYQSKLHNQDIDMRIQSIDKQEKVYGFYSTVFQASF